MLFGLQIDTTVARRPRSVVGAIEDSPAGNIVIRVGHENPIGERGGRGGWVATEHVVMPPPEALSFIAEVEALASAGEYENRRRKPDENRQAHIGRLVDQYAMPAFWRAVAPAFPQVQEGDVHPTEAISLHEAMGRAVDHWLALNEPVPTHDQLVAAGNLMYEAARGAFGVTEDVTAKLVGPDRRLPSQEQAGYDPQPHDLVVVVGHTFEGVERTTVMVIDRLGITQAGYEVE